MSAYPPNPKDRERVDQIMGAMDRIMLKLMFGVLVVSLGLSMIVVGAGMLWKWLTGGAS